MQESIRKILLVEDDEDTRLMVATLFHYSGYECVTVSSIAEGFSHAQSLAFDFILLDWNLKDGTGIDLCRQIRHFDQDTPIFFYTGVAYPKEIQKALQAGAQGCFIKPVDVNYLVRTLEKQFKSSHSHSTAE
ncbi:MAG: response regulator [Acidobacteria bacterium]|nr:response regulator [Acidobacteriota bacterium]